MRTDLTAGDRALLDSGDYSLHWKFLCDNGSGTAVDLSGRIHGLPTFKPPNPNVPAGTITFALHRELDRTANVSLAPFVEGSTLNRLDDGTTYAVLLEVGRDVTASVAITARGADRPATGYYEVLSGKIGRVDWPKYEGGDVIVFCRDKAGELQKVKSETAYTYAAGTAIETAIRQTLDNNGYSSVPIYTPTATGKVLSVQHAPGVQKTIWSQVWAFAQSIGWVCWFRYKADGTVALTLFEPDRNKSVSDFTVAKLRDYNAVGINEDELGNVGRCEYTDSNGVRQTTDPVEDAASISKYGNVRRSFWISLPDDSPVRANADAVALITAAVSDTAHPDTLGELVTPGNPFLECAVDLITVPADGRISDTARTYAPFSLTVGHPAGRDHESRINVRGKPSVGYRTWDAPSKHAVVGDAPETKLLQNFRARDSADGLSEVIAWTNGAKGTEVWYAVRTFTTPLAEGAWDIVQAAVDRAEPALIETLTVTKPTETDGIGRITLVQVELRWKDPATGNRVIGDVQRVKIYPKTFIDAIDPDTGDLNADTVGRSQIVAAAINAAKLDDGILDLTEFSRIVANGAIIGGKLSVDELSEIADGLGIVVSGVLQNAGANPTAAIRLDATDTLPATATTYLDLAATGSDPMLKHATGFSLNADGTRTWPDDVLNPPEFTAAEASGFWTGTGTEFSATWTTANLVGGETVDIVWYRKGANVGSETGVDATLGTFAEAAEIAGGASTDLVSAKLTLKTSAAVTLEVQTTMPFAQTT